MVWEAAGGDVPRNPTSNASGALPLPGTNKLRRLGGVWYELDVWAPRCDGGCIKTILSRATLSSSSNVSTQAFA